MQEGVVGGEIVAVVDAREVVEVGVVEEGEGIDVVHEEVEGGESKEGGGEEGEALFVEEFNHGLEEKAIAGHHGGRVLLWT